MSNNEKKSSESIKNMKNHSRSAPINEGALIGARVAPLGADAKHVPPKKK